MRLRPPKRVFSELPRRVLLGNLKVRAYTSKLTRLNKTRRFVKEYRETFTWAYVYYILASVE